MTPDHYAGILPQTKVQVAIDAISTLTAAGAVTFPIWFPALQNASEIAAALLPFLGIILITLQIIVYVRRVRRGNGDR